jgi:hypothetical protein
LHRNFEENLLALASWAKYFVFKCMSIIVVKHKSYDKVEQNNYSIKYFVLGHRNENKISWLIWKIYTCSKPSWPNYSVLFSNTVQTIIT